MTVVKLVRVGAGWAASLYFVVLGSIFVFFFYAVGRVFLEVQRFRKGSPFFFLRAVKTKLASFARHNPPSLAHAKSNQGRVPRQEEYFFTVRTDR